MIELLHTDCREYMKTLPDKAFDLAIVDPPYGIEEMTGKETAHGRGALKNRIFNQQADKFDRWDKAPEPEYFQELFRISKEQIIWGGNYFGLPAHRCFICWDKIQPWENFSQVEIAWTSFNRPSALFRYDNRRGDKIHPTQKPVKLYRWLLKKFASPGMKIFDSHLGSCSVAIACLMEGFSLTGCEKDKQHFEDGQKRFLTYQKKHLATPTLFNDQD